MQEQIENPEARWHAWPRGAAAVHAAVMALPIASSVVFVYAASRFVRPPTGSLSAYLGWWIGLSVSASLVLVVVGRLSRRLLPLAALLRLSLVFPHGAPSRLRTAIRSGTVRTLEDRLAEAKERATDATPTEAAHRLLALVAALDSHDSLTRGHSERVRAHAQLIGRQLGLKAREVDLLNWSALLHDIGKLEISREILTKEGRPTDAEWSEIKRHPELGAALVEPLRPWLGGWADAVSAHHERWDGTGYPRAVAGTDIPLAGRIVAVADVFDVITSRRSYKQASAATDARREIAGCAGTQFDPDVVRAFLATSLPRVRFAAGPLAWLAEAAVLARIPLVSAATTISAAAVLVTASPLPAADSGPPQPTVRTSIPAAGDLAAALVATEPRRTGRRFDGGVLRDSSGGVAEGAIVSQQAQAPATREPGGSTASPTAPTAPTGDVPTSPRQDSSPQPPTGTGDPETSPPLPALPPLALPVVPAPNLELPPLPIPPISIPSVPLPPEGHAVPPLPPPPSLPELPQAPALPGL